MTSGATRDGGCSHPQVGSVDTPSPFTTTARPTTSEPNKSTEGFVNPRPGQARRGGSAPDRTAGQLGGASEAAKSKPEEIRSEASSEAAKAKSEGKISPELIDDRIGEVGAERFKFNPGKPLELQPHRAASQARAKIGLTGKTHQSAHAGPQAALRGFPQDNARDVHCRFDSSWTSVFEAKAAARGTNRITVQELYDVVSESISAPRAQCSATSANRVTAITSSRRMSTLARLRRMPRRTES